MFQRVMPVLFCGLLAACADPLAGLDRIDDVDLAQQEGSAAALPTEEEILREGYFGTPAATGEVIGAEIEPLAKKPAQRGGLLGVFRPAPVERTLEGEAEAGAVASTETPDGAPQEDTLSAENTPTATTSPARTGFFGRLLARSPANDAAPEGTELASLTPSVTPRSGPDARDVAPGTILPFGEVARSCGTAKNQLGRKVDKAPAKGYTLYDTQPNTAAPRTFYLTGFSDGCPRQFTAANVLLGSAALYERLHYGPGGEFLPVGATDKAYEKVKRRVCGTGRRKPCGGKIKQMERSTFFVTAYSRFGNANSWSELLVHDGQVLAAAIKRNKS